MNDSSGFYKYESGGILFAPNFVCDANYTLHREEIGEYEDINTELVDGWFWFDSYELAKNFFNILDL